MANHRRTDTSEATLLFLERLKQTNPSEAVREAIEQAMANDGPAIMDFRVEPEENVYPHVPAGESIAEMIEGPLGEEEGAWQR